MKKRVLACLMAAALATTLLAGCGSSSSDETEETTEETEESAEAEEETEEAADLSGSVTTGGSTSMESLMEIVNEVFMETYPDVTISYDGVGSGAGATGVAEGSYDIGLTSRYLKDEEVEQGLTGTTVALDGICVIVNTANTVTDLSLEDIAAIFTGEITNWSEVGGEDAEIVCIGREAGSGTRDGFESITETEDLCVYSQEQTSTGGVITAVESNEYAIGYASMASVEDTVVAIAVDGVEASEDTVLDGTYAIQRPFVFVTNDATELSDQAQAFFDFVTGGDADEYISQAGVVPYHE